MGAGRAYRQQGPGQFVFALCAAFKALVAVGDAPFERGVVAGLEMQAVDALKCPPITSPGDAIAGVGAQRNQAAGDGASLALGQKQQPVLRLLPGDVAEKGPAQRGRVAVFQVGTFVAGVEEVSV